MMTACASPQFSRAQRGLSLVELMVGVAISLIVIAAATSLFSRHLRESRAVQVELRLMQDLRSAAVLVGRDLRRAGYWGNASAGVWQRDAETTVVNPYAFVTLAANQVAFNFSRDAAENNAVDTNEQFGFRLRGGVVEFLLGGVNNGANSDGTSVGNWLALTDVNTVTITAFTVTPSVQSASLEGMCATVCSAADSAIGICPPQHHQRSLAVALTGQSVTDVKVMRSVESHLRLRNDAITGACST